MSRLRLGHIGIAAAIAFVALAANGAIQGRSTSRTVFFGNLPALNGRSLQATVQEVNFPPGGRNPSHRHTCPVIGYVLEGAVRLQLQGRSERILKPGETFFESPSDVHLVSSNASRDVPARILATFVCDHEGPFSVPVPAEGKRP